MQTYPYRIPQIRLAPNHGSTHEEGGVGDVTASEPPSPPIGANEQGSGEEFEEASGTKGAEERPNLSGAPGAGSTLPGSPVYETTPKAVPGKPLPKELLIAPAEAARACG